MYAPDVRILRCDDGFQPIFLPLLVHSCRRVCCSGHCRGCVIIVMIIAATVCRSGCGRNRWRHRRRIDLLLGIWLHLEKVMNIAAVATTTVCVYV